MGEGQHLIPENRLSLVPVPQGFLEPDSFVRTRVEDFERGGVALNDSTQGLNVQNWTAKIIGDDLVVIDENDVATVILTRPGTTSISLAFDQAMRVTLAFVQDGVAKLWWFDTNINSMTETIIPGGAEFPRLGLDDKRESQRNNSDIILAYMIGKALYYRQQRDRYQIERLLATELKGRLRNIGMNAGNRFQFEFR